MSDKNRNFTLAVVVIFAPVVKYRNVTQSTINRKLSPVRAFAELRILADGFKEAHHLAAGVRSLVIGVTALLAAARPGVAGAMHHPVFGHRLAVAAAVGGARVAVAVRHRA